MTTTLIRPGILVSLKTTVAGGVYYRRVDLESAEATPSESVQSTDTEAPAAVDKWETTRTIVDPKEHESAVRTRGQASVAIRSQCARTTFGLLCPEGNEAQLDAAIETARAYVNAHNATAKYTHVEVYVLKGRIASTDEEAARAIASEVRSMLDEMENGIERLDARAIRDAAGRARQMATMLSDDKAQRVNDAIESAREAAREIVRRVTKKGEMAGVVLAQLDRGAIQSARMSFLDLDTPEVTSSAPAMPAVSLQRFDFSDDDHDTSDAAPVAVGA